MQSVAALPFAHGGPPVDGRLRVESGDFRVDEVLGFEPSGAGEHAPSPTTTATNTQRFRGRMAPGSPLQAGG